LEDAKLSDKKSNAVSASAVKAGADVIVTACPLCKYNLEKSGCEIPVVYITELLAEALGVKEDTNE
jgi:heterodisulfide reductase subunit B